MQDVKPPIYSDTLAIMKGAIIEYFKPLINLTSRSITMSGDEGIPTIGDESKPPPKH